MRKVVRGCTAWADSTAQFGHRVCDASNVHAAALVAGCVIISAVLWDAFETLVLPRTAMHKARLTRLYYRTTWRCWVIRARKHRSDRRRERFLAVYGPLSVIGLLTLWAAGLVAGFALLQWSQRELLLNLSGNPHFFDDLYMSATTLFSLGLGDVMPKDRGGRLLIVAETSSSLMLLTMVFAYLSILYQSFCRREVRLTMLDAWAGSPPAATEILRRVAASGDVSYLDGFFADWEYWCSDILESHLSYPAIAYFRSQHQRQSWVSALTTVLDLAALVKVGIEGLPTWRAHLTFAIARHAAVDLTQVLGEGLVQLEDRLPPHELAAVRCELERAGLQLNASAEADRELAELRKSYEPYIASLSNRLMMPLPCWRPALQGPDNWQTNPARDGGPHF
jgi:ion channel